jgi:hypothetical protein
MVFVPLSFVSVYIIHNGKGFVNRFLRKKEKSFFKKVLTNSVLYAIIISSGEGNNRGTPPTAEVESVLLKNEFPNKATANG